MPLLILRCCVQTAALKCLLPNFICKSVLSSNLSLSGHLLLFKVALSWGPGLVVLEFPHLLQNVSSGFGFAVCRLDGEQPLCPSNSL